MSSGRLMQVNPSQGYKHGFFREYLLQTKLTKAKLAQ